MPVNYLDLSVLGQAEWMTEGHGTLFTLDEPGPRCSGGGEKAISVAVTIDDDDDKCRYFLRL